MTSMGDMPANHEKKTHLFERNVLGDLWFLQVEASRRSPQQPNQAHSSRPEQIELPECLHMASQITEKVKTRTRQQAVKACFIGTVLRSVVPMSTERASGLVTPPPPFARTERKASLGPSV